MPEKCHVCGEPRRRTEFKDLPWPSKLIVGSMVCIIIAALWMVAAVLFRVGAILFGVSV